MNPATSTLIVLATLALAACGTTTGQRSLSGGAMGAAGGAALGAIGGNAGLGAAVGAGAGLLGGYLYDQQKKGNIDF
ncbi:MAG TPA: YMGG-like glycine zipper-containing protein [Stellaceae bacterium]|nr:YMGG-like glycine zipper-containing protein [Stellaceae bacterium]